MSGNASCSPVHEALGVAPVNGTDNLGRPPAQVGFENFAVVWAGLEYIPQSPAFGIVHHEVEVRGRLKSTQEMRCPLRLGLARSQEDVALTLRRALLHGA